MKYIKNFNESYSNSEFHKEIAEILKKECRPFIELSKSCNIELWRGVTHKFIDKHSTEISKLAYRVKHKDRKPIDTPSELHDRLNLAFIEKFGWPVRDGVFCLPDKGIALSYAQNASYKNGSHSEVYFLIPVGDFKYCWSPKYKDLTMDIKTKFPKYRQNDWKDELNNLSSTKIKNIVNTYKDNDIQDANYTSKKDASEISIDCKEYILLSQRYFIGVGYDFWNW
jgi:hypothetical protein